jgi:threonyl-tRNA synthetase
MRAIAGHADLIGEHVAMQAHAAMPVPDDPVAPDVKAAHELPGRGGIGSGGVGPQCQLVSEMFSIKLPDGSVREVERGTTPADVAAAIGPGLAKAALAARVNGEVRDLARPFEGDADLALITARDEAEALELARHDYAHVLAEAVQNLFPGTQITFGPATDDGFYYDFAPTAAHGPFTEEELPAIEAEMRRIIRADEALIREEWSREQVRDFFEQQGETFKAEWVMELPADETISMYRSGGWIDLCRGPHLASTGKLDPDAFKLTRVSGAYWRGDQRTRSFRASTAPAG